MLNLQMACLCDHAFLSIDSKLNIIGELSHLYFIKKYQDKSFIAPIYIVTAYLTDAPGDYQQIIRFINKNNNSKFLPDNISNFSIKKNKGYIITRLNLAFKDFGEYEIQILLDSAQSEPLIKLPLIVKEAPMQAKKN